MLVEVFFKNLPATVQKRFIEENFNGKITVEQLRSKNSSLFVNSDGEWSLQFGNEIFPNVKFYVSEVYECFRNSGRPNRLLGIAYSKKDVQEIFSQYDNWGNMGQGLTYVDSEGYLQWL